MKLVPLKKQIIGRLIITKTSESIIAPDPNTGVSKFVYVEAVSPEAEAEGYKVGDIVMPRHVGNIFLRGGRFHRVVFSIDDAICCVRDVPLTEFVDGAGKPVEAIKEEAAA